MTTLKKKYWIKPLTLIFLFFSLIMLNVVIASTANKFLGDWNKDNKLMKSCGSYEGHTLRKGPTKGGCFYINKDNKTIYVDKRLCDC